MQPETASLGLRARCSGRQQERPVFPDLRGSREQDIMRLVLIAGLSLGSMVAAHSEPGFAFGVRTPKKYASLAIRKSVLSPMEFEAQQRVLRRTRTESSCTPAIRKPRRITGCLLVAIQGTGAIRKRRPEPTLTATSRPAWQHCARSRPRFSKNIPSCASRSLRRSRWRSRHPPARRLIWPTSGLVASREHDNRPWSHRAGSRLSPLTSWRRQPFSIVGWKGSLYGPRYRNSQLRAALVEGRSRWVSFRAISARVPLTVGLPGTASVAQVSKQHAGSSSVPACWARRLPRWVHLPRQLARRRKDNVPGVRKTGRCWARHCCCGGHSPPRGGGVASNRSWS
jgi:hypothetical protein